jgi:outer membrane protein assembly factor BamE (lipoprotein component of BamABCDE complex)
LLSGILVVGAIVFGVYAMRIFSEQLNSDKDIVTKILFDKEAWKESKAIEKQRTVRSQMIDDLLQKYQFKSMTKEEIIDLLGKPIIPQDRYTKEEWDMLYLLGLERYGAWSLDDEFLAFKFDEDGKVSHFRATTMK